MLLPGQIPELRDQIRAQARRDSKLFDELIAQASDMASGVRPIRPRSATSVALMAADGGSNAVTFNPFSLQIVRIVDSAGEELFLDVVSPTADIGELSRRHLDGTRVHTALGRMMADLGVGDLRELSGMMSGRSPRWIDVYRDLCEWATLYDLVCYHNFAADTLIVRDGLLRAPIFAGDLLVRVGRLLRAAIDRNADEHRRHVWLAGLAKRTVVLDHYRLAMSVAGVFDRGTPCFVKIPARMQESVYRRHDYLRSPDDAGGGGNIGEMFFVRFGSRTGDPVWTADLLAWQARDAQAIFGYLQADAVAGFPVPFYPYSLQQADAHSRVDELDTDVVENTLVESVRELVGQERAHVVDALRLTTDVAARRYG
jgi:hypothetical protein